MYDFEYKFFEYFAVFHSGSDALASAVGLIEIADTGGQFGKRVVLGCGGIVFQKERIHFESSRILNVNHQVNEVFIQQGQDHLDGIIFRSLCKVIYNSIAGFDVASPDGILEFKYIVFTADADMLFHHSIVNCGFGRKYNE